MLVYIKINNKGSLLAKFSFFHSEFFDSKEIFIEYWKHEYILRSIRRYSHNWIFIGWGSAILNKDISNSKKIYGGLRSVKVWRLYSVFPRIKYRHVIKNSTSLNIQQIKYTSPINKKLCVLSVFYFLNFFVNL